MSRFTPPVALLVLTVSACGPARWIPPERPGETGQCSRDRACGGSHECMVVRRDDYLLCAVDRARQLGDARGPRAGFDELALSILNDELASILLDDGYCDVDHDTQKASIGELLRFYPAVRREIDDAARAGLVDLAAKRAVFVKAAFNAASYRGAPELSAVAARLSAELSAVIAAADKLHIDAASRLGPRLSGAALYHLCGWRSNKCPNPNEPRDLRASVGAAASKANLEVDVREGRGCEGLLQKPADGFQRSNAGAVRTTRVSIDLQQCGPLAEEVEDVTIVCPSAQKASGGSQDQGRSVRARRITSRFDVVGEVRVDGRRIPLHVTEARVHTDVPDGCGAPKSPSGVTPLELNAQGAGSPISTARDVAVSRLNDGVRKALEDAARVEPRELVDAAKRAVAAGDLDTADHFYGLALRRRDDSDAVTTARVAAEEWFAGRYGELSNKEEEPRYGYVKTRIGIVSRNSSIPDRVCRARRTRTE